MALIVKLVTGSVCEGKGKGSPCNRPRRPIGGVEVWLYSLFNLSSRWGWVVNSRSGRFTPGKDPVPIM